MTEAARRCIEVILKNEGGFQNDPDDLGNWNRLHNEDCEYPLKYMSDTCRSCKKCLIGTMRGIAARYFAHLYDIPKMTLRECTSAYYFHFWLPQNVNLLIGHCSDDLILQLFDYGVNTSIRFANKTLQKIIGAYQDGFIGNETKNKLYEYEKDGGDILEDYKHARRVWYEYIASKRNNQKYLKGWLNRIEKTHF